jgi:hypothetical protein
LTANRLLLLACALAPLLVGCPQDSPETREIEEVADDDAQPEPAVAKAPAPAVEPVLPVAWESCPNAQGYANFSRAPVPTGWLVLVSGEESDATFVPDPAHAWLKDAPRRPWMKDQKVPELQWERFERGERLATPEGWLVILPGNYYDNDAIYVPDPAHTWLADLPVEAPESG